MAAQRIAHARAVEVDLLRTLAIILMVFYHAAFDLRVYWGIPIDVFDGAWWWLARCTGVLFLFLVGISSVLANRRHASQAARVRRGTLRAVEVLAAAACITVASYLFDPHTFIRFGVLHCIGSTMLVLPLLHRYGEWNALWGIGIIAAGRALGGITAPTGWLLPLHITYPGFTSLDYYPLLPWSGVIFLGLAAGSLLYVRLGWQGWRPSNALWHRLTWPGRHALLIYMVHQPLLLLLLRHTLGNR